MEQHISDTNRRREGKPFVIYALVCPITLEVKYVGQATDLNQRTQARTHAARQGDPVRDWIDSLGGYLRPYRVILERGVNRLVRVKVSAMRHGAGRPSLGYKDVWLSSCLETKWIKRFQRTVLNRRVKQVDSVYDALKNPPLPWEA